MPTFQAKFVLHVINLYTTMDSCEGHRKFKFSFMKNNNYNNRNFKFVIIHSFWHATKKTWQLNFKTFNF